MATVVLEKLSKLFPVGKREEIVALHEVSLSVADGELLVLVGPSGSGKTTLLRLIAGLDQATAGSISIGGVDMTSVPPQDREVSMVFQDHALYPHMTVRENLGFGLRLRGVAKTEIERRVKEAAAILGVESLLDRSPAAISGGERQRVALGRALVLRPRVFLMDEPISNLDAPLRAEMRREIVRLHRELRITTIYVTHDQAEAMCLADRIAVIQGGRLQDVGRPLDLYARPGNMFVAGFIGSPPINLLPGALVWKGEALWFRGQASTRSAGQEWMFPLHSLDTGAAVGPQPAVVGLRPEHIRPLAPGESPPGNDPVLDATIDTIETLGWETHLWLRTGDLKLVSKAILDETPKPGETIRVSLHVAKALVFDEEGRRIWP